MFVPQIFRIEIRNIFCCHLKIFFWGNHSESGAIIRDCLETRARPPIEFFHCATALNGNIEKRWFSILYLGNKWFFSLGLGSHLCLNNSIADAPKFRWSRTTVFIFILETFSCVGLVTTNCKYTLPLSSQLTFLKALQSDLATNSLVKLEDLKFLRCGWSEV